MNMKIKSEATGYSYKLITPAGELEFTDQGICDVTKKEFDELEEAGLIGLAFQVVNSKIEETEKELDEEDEDESKPKKRITKRG